MVARRDFEGQAYVLRLLLTNPASNYTCYANLGLERRGENEHGSFTVLHRQWQGAESTAARILCQAVLARLAVVSALLLTA